jgi:hypothetical protein
MKLGKTGYRRRTGIGYEDINTAECLRRSSIQILDVSRLGDIGNDGDNTRRSLLT